MVSAALVAQLSDFRASVIASKPIAALTPLQLAALVALGRALVAAVDAEAASTAAVLDGPDPSGHPLAMIAAIRARAAAAQDARDLADLRGLVGRAVLNLSAGYV